MLFKLILESRLNFNAPTLQLCAPVAIVYCCVQLCAPVAINHCCVYQAVGQDGEGPEHVLAVDELWNEQRTVCLLVKELRDGVRFEVSNVGQKSAMIQLTCRGENLEPLESRSMVQVL